MPLDFDLEEGFSLRKKLCNPGVQTSSVLLLLLGGPMRLMSLLLHGLSGNVVESHRRWLSHSFFNIQKIFRVGTFFGRPTLET